MIIAIEGALGVGKSTLVRLCAQWLPCLPIYEEAERNPFLAAFYHAQDRPYPQRVQAHGCYELAEHVQYTFLFLQEWQWRQAHQLSQQGHLVLCDFHPLKSLVFSQVILSPEQREPLRQRYETLCIPPPDLLIYLKAREDMILSRVRKRLDPYRDQIDMVYVLQLLGAYDTFLRTYPGAYLTLDTTHLDYVQKPQDLQIPLDQIRDYVLRNGPKPEPHTPASSPGPAESSARATSRRTRKDPDGIVKKGVEE